MVALHLIVEVGAVASICSVLVCVASALPALSKARYLTVVVAESVNAPE